MTKEQKEAYDKAIKDREQSMKKNKELNDAFIAGMAAMQAKDYDTAITSLTKASELDPKQVAVWAQLADAHVNAAAKKTGAEFDAEMAKGIEAYTKAIELNPTDAATHNNFALALGKAKKFPEMQAELQKAAELDPPKAGQYYYNLGAMLVNAGQAEPAGQAFKKAIELDPEPRRFLLSVRRLPGRQGVLRRRWQSDAGARHGGSLPEVSGTGAHRPVRRFRQRHARLHGREGGHVVQESQRARARRRRSKSAYVSSGAGDASRPDPMLRYLIVDILLPLLVFALLRSFLRSLFQTRTRRDPRPAPPAGRSPTWSPAAS